MEDTIRQKRSTNGGDHSELPCKKIMVSWNDKENKMILAEASFQPNGSHESNMLELSWAWEAKYRRSICEDSVGTRSFYSLYSRDMDI